MEAVEDFFQYLDDAGIHIAMLLAGAFGAFVKMGPKDELSFLQGAVVVVSGALIANYLTPVVFLFYKVPESIQFSVGFLVGLGGLESVKWIMFKLKERFNKE